jgi:hypothetical protein
MGLELFVVLLMLLSMLYFGLNHGNEALVIGTRHEFKGLEVVDAVHR